MDSVTVLLPGFFVPENQWILDSYQRLERLFGAGRTVQAIRVADSRAEAEALAVHLTAWGEEAVVTSGGSLYLAELIEDRGGGGWPERGDFRKAMLANCVVVLLS
jgi:hypothetical protein